MDGQGLVLLKTVLDIIGSFGIMGVLGLLILFLYKGDLLPRSVWEELTVNITRQLMIEIKEYIAEIVDEVRETERRRRIKDLDDAQNEIDRTRR